MYAGLLVDATFHELRLACDRKVHLRYAVVVWIE